VERWPVDLKATAAWVEAAALLVDPGRRTAPVDMRAQQKQTEQSQRTGC